ncbi:MAG: hypothetical protein JWP95_2213 [Actinotalea sp.]|nr:hypothetical protein [Actinotalea sp.]
MLALLGAVVVGRALSVAPTTFVERAGAATSGPDAPAVAGIATDPVVPGEAADPPRTSGGGDSGPDAAGASAATGAVVVHVVGQVARPGVVTLPAGARVTDAIAAAGGATAEADLGALNLARVVADGEQVAVLRPGEQAPPPATGPTGGSQPDGTVDLNQAELADLDALPGIGPVLAQRILDWRGESGPFTSVHELREVTGIGPAVYDGIRDLVRV